jgi:hypothetical protein
MDSADAILFPQQRAQKNSRVDGGLLGEVVDLMTARSPRGYDGGGWVLAANLREQPPFSDLF